MSSSETSRPSRRKNPSSTAAAAGKYEFEMRSGTASFIVYPRRGLACQGWVRITDSAELDSRELCGLRLAASQSGCTATCCTSLRRIARCAEYGADPALKQDSPEERHAHQGTERPHHAHRRGDARRRADAALLAACRFVRGAFDRRAGADGYLRRRPGSVPGPERPGAADWPLLPAPQRRFELRSTRQGRPALHLP